MDEFAGLDKGWNDPDMLVIGMGGISDTMCRTHMAMWCMLNAPLMLGLDLRRISKGDALYNIISNKDLIALDQDPLGIQAKRVFTTVSCIRPDKEYIRDNKRTDVLVKPLANGDIAIGFFNLDQEGQSNDISMNIDMLIRASGDKIINKNAFLNAGNFRIKDLLTGEESESSDRSFGSGILNPCDCKVIRITPLP